MADTRTSGLRKKLFTTLIGLSNIWSHRSLGNLIAFIAFLSHWRRCEYSRKKQIKHIKRCLDKTRHYSTMQLTMPDFGFNQRTLLQSRTAMQSPKTLYLQDLLIQGSTSCHPARVLKAWWSSSLKNPHLPICGKASSSKNIFLEEVRTVIIYQWNIKYGYVSQACMLILHRVESNKTRQRASLGDYVEAEGSS